MKKYTFAIVGALGNVGSVMREIMEESLLPIGDLILMDIPENEGQMVKWRDRRRANPPKPREGARCLRQ